MKTCQETIIILHGWQSSKERWQVVKQELQKRTENGFYPPQFLPKAKFGRASSIRVVVPDLPGFKKETALDRVWDLDNYIRWLENFISENSKTSCPELAEGFFLLGHSFGGRMAIKFAAKYPEKLKGLILLSSAGIKPKQNILYLTFLAIARFVKFIFLKIPLLKNSFPVFRNIFYKYILRKTDYLKAEKFPYLKETFKNIIKEDLTGELSKIKVPTLIIWGDKDRITPLKDAYLINKEIKNSNIEVIKNIGHMPHQEVPDILVEKIIDFIKK